MCDHGCSAYVPSIVLCDSHTWIMMYFQQLSSSRASAILQHCLFADMAPTAANAHLQSAMEMVKALHASLDALGETLRESVDGRQEPIQGPSEEAIDDETEQEAGQDSSEEVMTGGVGVDESPTEMEDEDGVRGDGR